MKMTERSDIHKYSIVNLQSSIPVYPGWVIIIDPPGGQKILVAALLLKERVILPAMAIA
jgi:hypothetical protein